MSTLPPPFPGHGPPPPPRGNLPAEVRNWAMAGHLSSLIQFVGIFSFLGPLIVWLVKKDEHPFVAEHARDALNFNLSLLLYAAVFAIGGIIVSIATFGVALLALVPIGILLTLTIGVLWLVLTIIAAVRAANGEPYRYPLTIPFVR